MLAAPQVCPGHNGPQHRAVILIGVLAIQRHSVARCIQHAHIQRQPLVGAVGLHQHLHKAVFHLAVRLGFQHKVPNVLPLGGIKIHIPKDTAQAPHILALQPGAGAPTVHLHADHIGPLLQIAGHIKLSPIKTGLTVAHPLAVNIEIKSALHTLKAQHYPLLQQIGAYMDTLNIAAHRVVLGGCCRRANILVPLPGITHIAILALVVALHLPGAGHLHCVPVVGVVMHLGKVRRPVRIIFIELKLPLAV